MSPAERQSAGAMAGDTHNPIVQGLIETGAVNFDAIGKALAQIGPSAASLRASGEDWFCKFYHSFIHIYIISKIASLADLGTLREMANELRG